MKVLGEESLYSVLFPSFPSSSSCRLARQVGFVASNSIKKPAVFTSAKTSPAGGRQRSGRLPEICGRLPEIRGRLPEIFND